MTTPHDGSPTPTSWPRRRPGEPPAVLAHRGGRGPWRENTVAAFVGALSAGADGVELDVRRSADGVAVVHHDAGLEGVPIAVSKAAALPPWLPTLAHALDACAGRAVNVELKLEPAEIGGPASVALAEAVCPVITGARSVVVVSSFWPGALEAVSALSGRTALALLVHPALDVADALARARDLGCVAVHPHVSQVSVELVGRAHDLGLGVTTWTVDDPADVDRALAGGVDGIITDQVSATVAACRAC